MLLRWKGPTSKRGLSNSWSKVNGIERKTILTILEMKGESLNKPQAKREETHKDCKSWERNTLNRVNKPQGF